MRINRAGGRGRRRSTGRPRTTSAGWRGGLRCWGGRTSEEELDAITRGAGDHAQLYRGLRDLRDRYGPLVRERFPDIPRQVSGYNLDALLPEHGFDIAQLLVGSEGTLVTVLRLQLVPVLEHTAMLVLGYPDIIAADAVPEILASSSDASPVQLEVMDQRMSELMRNQGVHLDSLQLLTDGMPGCSSSSAAQPRTSPTSRPSGCSTRRQGPR